MSIFSQTCRSLCVLTAHNLQTHGTPPNGPAVSFGFSALLPSNLWHSSPKISSNCPDFEDAIMIETAARTEVDCIVTRNLNYKSSPVPAYSPSAFVKLLIPEGQAD